jgi:rubrerythrin
MKALSNLLIMTVFFSSVSAVYAFAEKPDTIKPKKIVVVSKSGAATTIVPILPAPAEKTTLDNLQTAFNGESNAHARYLVFAKKADTEGYGKAASLFRAAARAEKVHFTHHSKIIKELGGVPSAKIEPAAVKTTAENLETAMKGEIYESTVMYPEFLARAEKDRIRGAIDTFEDAGKAEAVHASLYKKALENLPEWEGKSQKFEVCTFCGNVVEKINFKDCPICGKSKDLYVSVR